MSASNAYSGKKRGGGGMRSRSSSRERLGRKTPRLTPQRVQPPNRSTSSCGTVHQSASVVRRSVSASALTPRSSQTPGNGVGGLRDKAAARRKEAEIRDFCVTTCGLTDTLAFPLSSGQYKNVFTMITRYYFWTNGEVMPKTMALSIITLKKSQLDTQKWSAKNHAWALPTGQLA